MQVVALAILLSLPQAVGVTVGTSVGSDATGGLLAPSPNAERRPTVTGALTPGASVLVAAGNYRIRMSYNLRMFRRYELGTIASGTDPNATEPLQSADRFLVSHSGALNAGLSLAKGWALSTSMDLSIGELDLPGANSSFTPVSSTAPTQSTSAVPTGPQASTVVTQPIVGVNVLESRTASAVLLLTGKLSKNLTLDLSSRLTYQGSFASGGGTLVNYPSARSISLVGDWAYNHSLRDTFNITSGTTYSLSTGAGDYRSLNLMVGYGRAFGPNSKASLAVGILHIKKLSSGTAVDPVTMLPLANTEPSKKPVPAFNLSVGTQFLNFRDFKLRGMVGSGVSIAVSPNTGVLEERGSLMVGLGSSMGSRWGVSLQTSFSSPATATPRAVLATASEADEALRQTETALNSQLQISYLLSSNFSVTAAFSASTYAPRLVDPSFVFRSPDLIGSLRLSMSVAQGL